MARVKQIKLNIGSDTTAVIDVGDICSEDFMDIDPPKASVKSCQACLKKILNILQGRDDSSSES